MSQFQERARGLQEFADSYLTGVAMADKRDFGDTCAPSSGAGERRGRRRHPRYLFSAAMTVRLKDGVSMPGMSVEMSSGGMSAMVSGLLSEGDTVQLAPVAGGPALGRVRHKLGQLYGFEFVELTAEQAERIAQKCAKFGRRRRAVNSA